jgi:hypothetical protein
VNGRCSATNDDLADLDQGQPESSSGLGVIGPGSPVVLEGRGVVDLDGPIENPDLNCQLGESGESRLIEVGNRARFEDYGVHE